MRALFVTGLTTIALLASACGDDQYPASEVFDLRLLAVRADPPEILFDRDPATGALMPLSTDGKPAGQVHFDALVVDPRGGVVEFNWRFCPIESDVGCDDYDAVAAEAPVDLLPAMNAARLQAGSGSVPMGQDNIYAVAPFSAQVGPEIGAYHMLMSGFGGGNGAWPGAVVTVNNQGETLRAQKRVVLNLRDPFVFAQELKAGLGVDVCGPDGLTPTGCLAVPARTANRNPVIAQIQWADGDVAGAPFAPLPVRDAAQPEAPDLILRPGQKVRLLPVMAPDAEETYAIVDSALQDNRLFVDMRQERSVVSWFATLGEFGTIRTSVLETKTLDNTFTAPQESIGQSGVIWVVVRDGRGGASWQSLRVAIQP